ncbi:MAG TPA: phosphohistidine phosphatase SixA [Chthoniobacterales bacterium]|nr:phosphohistidine phosphatase SixA [Chthoniobacterales bacterium]
MKVYFLRHGKADWLDWDKPDDERPLTKNGRGEMEQIAEFLSELGAAPSVILSSPLPRARQTAEIAAKALKLEVQEEPLLKKGFSAAKLRTMLRRAKGGDVMIVGHEPDFSAVIRELTGGAVALKKGGVARVDLEDATSTNGTLVWLIPPKVMRR